MKVVVAGLLSKGNCGFLNVRVDDGLNRNELYYIIMIACIISKCMNERNSCEFDEDIL